MRDTQSRYSLVRLLGLVPPLLVFGLGFLATPALRGDTASVAHDAQTSAVRPNARFGKLPLAASVAASMERFAQAYTMPRAKAAKEH